MADETLLLNGFSIIGDPQTNTNAKAGGNLMIHNGTAVFEDNDIVVIEVDYVTVDGILTDDTVVVGIIVYDNGTDYYNDVPKYTYDYSGSGDGAEIPNGRNGMGDRYLEFDASDLTSSDTNAPVLGEISMVAGVNILGVLADTNGPYVVPTFEDIDIDGNGTIDPDEQGDGQFSSDLNDIIVICFARGTLIETPDGPRFIETLAEGDLVTTLDNGPRAIRWIGGRKTDATGQNAPVWIKAGALGNIRDLWVSQNHKMLVRGGHAELLFGQSEVLVAAKFLVNDTTIRIVPKPQVEYFHFLLDGHEIVFAEGCPSESLYPGEQSLESVPERDRDEIFALFPSLELGSNPMVSSRYALRFFEAQALRLIG